MYVCNHKGKARCSLKLEKRNKNGKPADLYTGCVCVCVAQSCPSLCDPMDCSLPCSSVYGDSPGKNIGVGCHALLQGTFPTQGSNPSSPALQADSLPSEPPVKPHTCIHSPPNHHLLSRLPCNIEQSSLCYTVGPCWLFIFNKAVCTRPFLTP